MFSIREFCTILGATALMTLITGAICGIWEVILNKIKDKKRQYNIQHKFDKPPVADCYCIDCVHYHCESNTCDLPGIERHTPYNGFCYEAHSRKDGVRSAYEDPKVY